MPPILPARLPDPDWASIDAWLRRSYPTVRHLDVDALAAWLDDPSRPAPHLLDVRSPHEHAVSSIPGAVLAPSLDDALAALRGVDAAAPVVCFCSVGVRSARLAHALDQRGWRGAVNLRGSLFAWANRGGALSNARGPAERVHPFNAAWGVLLDAARRAPT
jgi:rhodanese-related sulfurtransferase